MIKIKNGKEYILKEGKWIRNINDDEIIQLYLEFKTINKVAKYLKIDNNAVKKILLKNNIHINTHKEALKISMNSDDVRDKLKRSYQNSIEKRKETCIERYGHEYASQSSEFKDKIKKTSIEKYGSEHFLSSNVIKEKRINTIQNKYGVENISQVKEIRDKIENTNLSKYGVKHSCKSKDIIQKIKNSNLNKYGVECIFELKKFRDKREKTNLKRYGYKNIMHNTEIKNKAKKSNFNSFFEKFNKLLNYLDLKLLDEYKNAYFKHNWLCLKCNKEFIQIWNSIQQGRNCPYCNNNLNTGVSKIEIEIFKFLEQIINNDILNNNRSIISPKELDIYIPDKKVAIEFNGLYWHSDKYINETYHLDKTNICEKLGIQLIHIFEDEWIFKQDIVKSRLKQILNINDSKRIHARKCEIREINSSLKNEFLEKYHIQGKDNSVIKLGVFYNDELVSVMTFSHGNISKGSKQIENVWELNRFAINYNYHIPGIASKLLKYFQRNYEWKEIFSYADRRWSQGNVYYKLGFELDSITRPNYWYLKGGKRIHRFALRKRPDEPKDISERILREQEGYERIWDCGNLKFIIKK